LTKEKYSIGLSTILTII